MRKTRHDGVNMLLRQIEQSTLHDSNQNDDFIDGGAHKQPDVGCDLIVTGSPGVQSFASITNQRGQSFFNIQMHIFKIKRPDKFIVLDFLANLAQSLLNCSQIVTTDDALCREHVCMSQ